MRRTIAAALGAVAALVISLAGASAAYAYPVDHCAADQSKQFALPNKTDVIATVMICIQTDSDGTVRSRFNMHWRYNGPPLGANYKFDRWDATIRTERRQPPSTTDSIVNSATCSFMDDFNDGYIDYNLECYTGWVVRSNAYYYSGDATVVFDIDGDGKGSSTWNLTGSPLV
ncbi:hypothetical protein [Umezawaea sp.]|uniref:hypothetical protein n=1 Tax=Umezawaea sp. TaxID=1955258 RepID=UPI002ED695D1